MKNSDQGNQNKLSSITKSKKQKWIALEVTRRQILLLHKSK